MAVPQPGVWGIDLGQCALKAIRLEKIDDAIHATAFDYIEYPKILTQPDADPDQLTREALEMFLSRNRLRGDMVAISVPGQSGLARFVKLPPVEEKKIADIVKFEAKQQIPFPLDEVVWDFQKINAGEVTDGFAMETEIGLFAIKRDMVNRYLEHFTEVGVEVHIVQMAPLALCNFVAYQAVPTLTQAEEDGKKPCVVALDMGTDNSSLVITDGDRIIWQRPIPIGGNHFTRALTKDMKLTFAKAEHLKRHAVKSPDLKKILSSLKQVLNDFLGEVQRSLGYFTNTHRDAQVQFMIGMGNAFKLPGLQKYIQEKLQLEVRKLTNLGQVEGDEVTHAPTFTDNILSFGVAYGLALQGLGLTRLQTNLLPHEIRVQRLIRAKKPWAVTAAAVLLLGIAGLTFGRTAERAAVVNPELKTAKDDAKRAIDRLNRLNLQFKEIQEKIQKSNLNIRRLGSGLEERFNWQLLHEYVNMALPLPNGDRIADRNSRNFFAKKEFVNKDAQDAFLLQEKRRFALNKGAVGGIKAQEEDEFIKKKLTQINIEAISTMWSDDLSSYYRNIHNHRKNLTGMTLKEQENVVGFVVKGEKKDLPMSGWVVEIRGYTYHDRGWQFVDETFLDNLAHPKNIPDNLKLLAQVGRDKEMAERVHKRIGYFLILENWEVPNPKAGAFHVIGNMFLPHLLKAEAAAPVAPGQDPAPGAAPAGPAQRNRDGWVPAGEVQGVPFAGGKLAAPVAVAEPKDEKSAKIVPAKRTEFVILFIWQEPLLESLPASAPPAPDPPDAIPGVADKQQP